MSELDLFSGSTVDIAKKLLGCVLVTETSQGRVSGRIVETESYLQNDPASHGFRKKTERNAPMFGPAGTAYVYFTYGMHYCFNVVTAEEGLGEAVLIRALEPLDGIELMKERRGLKKYKEDGSDLCSGPAKLVQALDFAKEENGVSLLSGKLRIEVGEPVNDEDIVVTTRIGITEGADLPLRFYVRDNVHVSKK